MVAEITNLGVVGCGTMGSGICELCALSGIEVVFCEVDSVAAAAGLQRIERRIDRAVELGRLSPADANAGKARVSSTTALDGLAGCDFVIEAVPEKLDLKKEVFARLDEILAPEAMLATNTSSLPVIDLAVATRRPSRVIGFHFFNPAQVMRLVELVVTVTTEPEVLDRARRFAHRLGKTPVQCRDRAGFLANVLLFPYLSSAVRLLDQGYATREDIDGAMKLGCGHPMGPLELLDLIGLDAAYEICEALYREFRSSLDAPPPLLRQYVTAGYLGRKSGRGFYGYEGPDSKHIVDAAEPPAAAGPSGIDIVGVAGTGVMACGIAEVAARAGNRVVMRGRSAGAARGARDRMAASLDRAVRRGKTDAASAEAVLGRIEASSEFEALAEADLVVEAVAEELGVKIGVFAELDRAVKPEAILATTTSSLPVVHLAAATARPERVLGLHFFNPAQVMRLVEVVATVATSPETLETAAAWVRELGRHPVGCRDRAGFIVNFLLFPYLNDAVTLHDQAIGTLDDIDAAMKLGCAHPLGPFELMDLVGLDVTRAILATLHDEFREPRYAPAPLLDHLVRAGYLGRKTGRGFRLHGR